MSNIASILLSASLLCYASTYAQQGLQSDSFSENSYLYTKEQIDSIFPTIRTYFYEAHHEKIIEQVPQLIRNASHVGAAKVEGGLRTILGNSFIQLDDFDSAYSLFSEMLEEAKKQKDTLKIQSSYANLGNTFITQEPEKSITYFEQGLTYVSDDATSEVVTFIIHNNLAELYVGIENHVKAQYHLDKAFPFMVLPSLNARKNEYEAALFHVQGAIYLLQKKYKKSIEYTQRSLDRAGQNMDGNYTLNNYKNLILAYDALGQYEKLNEVRKLHDVLRDQRYEEDKVKQQEIARSKFNLDTYERKLRESQLKNELTQQKASKNKLLFNFTALFVGVLVLLIVALLLGRHKRNNLLKNLKIKNKQYLAAKDKSEGLAQSNTRLLSTISHELRTPLYGIIGLSSVLLKTAPLDEHKEELKSLKFSADYLLALVNDVLQINKLESDEGKILKKDHFVLEQLIKGIVQSFEFLNAKNNNRVYTAIDADLPTIVVADMTKLSQVLMNLLSNASKFTEDGKIYVEVSGKKIDETHTEVFFSIRDTGVGIPEDQQRHIFDEFTQVKKNQNHDGTGLGLPIVNKVLKVLGSSLNFKSTLGEGTTFSFYTTLEEGSKEELEVSLGRPNIEYLKDRVILIVDDNRINQLVTQKVLEQNGMAYDFANNGIEAVEKVGATQYDAVLMDINMPVMNGLEASKEIRKFNTTIPIIALTATNYQEINQELEANGFNDTISKPYHTEQLLTLLIKNLGAST